MVGRRRRRGRIAGRIGGRGGVPVLTRGLVLVTAMALATALVVTLLGSGSQAGAAGGERPGPRADERGSVGRAGTTYAARVRRAIEDLPVHREVRDGYDRDLFPHWIDADGDGCDTRDEVLIAEADDPVRVGSGCSLSGGRWFSYYDHRSWRDTGRIDIDHLVPLAEAWDSGAGGWRTAVRRRYANDLGDRRTLVGVTDSVNASKGDRDPSEWLPAYGRCRYLREWVVVKHRWRLRVDRPERRALRTLADGCPNRRITVTLAR